MKKISELQNIDSARRMKDPEKLVEALGKIVNLMKLSKQHKKTNFITVMHSTLYMYNLLSDNLLVGSPSAAMNQKKALNNNRLCVQTRIPRLLPNKETRFNLR